MFFGFSSVGWTRIMYNNNYIIVSSCIICADKIILVQSFWLVLFCLQIKSLIGTKVEWLYYILEAFNTGDLVHYQKLCHVHQAALTAQPALVQNEKKLLEKINILCLMEIIFRYSSSLQITEVLITYIVRVVTQALDNSFACSRPAYDRTIPLSVIAERTKLSVEDVEYLLMKSLSVSSH